MELAFARGLLAALAGFAVWSVVQRFWHLVVVAALALALMPLLASSITRDVSRYLPGWWFRDGIRGKDDIVLASVAATLLLAVLLAAFLFATGRAVRRLMR